MVWTLGIETSTRQGSIALADGTEIRAARSLGPVSQQHARNLFVEIDAAFRDCGLTPRDLGCVAVSHGPGSFTGLRIGVVAAKTLAWSLGCEVKAIDTFLGLADQLESEVSDAFVIGDAQRGDLFVGRYSRNGAGNWISVVPVRVLPHGDFVDSLAPDDLVTGPGLARYASELEGRCRLAAADLRVPRAENLCRLARREDLPAADFWALEPFYLRKSAAEETWDAREKMS